MSFSLNGAHLLMAIVWFASSWNCVQLATEKIETIQPKTLALNDGSTENDDICGQIRTGQTGILALGASPNRFLLISTNLFVYELELTAQDPEKNPPFKLLVTGRPVSMRDRWPEAYNWAQSHSGDILYSFVSTQYHFQAEYVIIVYRTNVTVCSVALDLNSGALLSGPCDDSLQEYEITSIGTPPQSGGLVSMLVASRQNGGTTVCLQLGTFYAAEPKTELDPPVPCSTFDQCRHFFVIPSELAPQVCFPQYTNPIVTIFQYRLEKIYLIDSTGQVYLAHIGADYLKVPPLPLDKFIGCNEGETIKLQFGEKWLWIVIVLGLLLQMGICAVIFLVFGQWNQLSASDRETGAGRSRSGSPKSSLRRSSKGKSSLRRSSKSRSSLRHSSKSKSSIGGRSRSNISSPTKSKSIAPSTSSHSRSVSMQRPSLSRSGTSKASSKMSSKCTNKRSPSNKSHFSKADSSVSHSTTHKKSSK